MQALTPVLVTMYDTCSYVLKPATYFFRCSFVELISEDEAPKKPDWFASHWCAHDAHVVLPTVGGRPTC